MRRAGVFLTIVVITCAFARSDASLDELIQKANAASVGQQPGLYTEIAERQLQAADRLYNGGKTEAARAALDNVVTYSDKACAAANHTRGKLKSTEIAMRRMAAKLRDIARTLAFDDQPPVQAAADHLEGLRSGLLSRMFAKDQ